MRPPVRRHAVGALGVAVVPLVPEAVRASGPRAVRRVELLARYVLPGDHGWDRVEGRLRLRLLARDDLLRGCRARRPGAVRVRGVDDDAHPRTEVAGLQDEGPTGGSANNSAASSSRSAVVPLVAEAGRVARPRPLRGRQPVAEDERACDRRATDVDRAVPRTHVARGRVSERNEDNECSNEDCGDAAAFHGSGLRGLEGRGRAPGSGLRGHDRPPLRAVRSHERGIAPVLVADPLAGPPHRIRSYCRRNPAEVARTRVDGGFDPRPVPTRASANAATRAGTYGSSIDWARKRNDSVASQEGHRRTGIDDQHGRGAVRACSMRPLKAETLTYGRRNALTPLPGCATLASAVGPCGLFPH
jgi:hypothetical protein